MKSSSASLLIAIIALLTFSFQNPSFANNGSSDGARYTYTSHKLSAKEFRKAYQAAKKEYQSIKSSSTKKMLRKRKGSWLQRWYNRNL